jgi:NAD+ dependent glucose-6-phosphate dehydrogenase
LTSEATRKKRVLVTGAAGTIGSAVRNYLGDRFELHFVTHHPADFPSTVADVTDLEAIQPAFEVIDAVVHLAASAAVETPWEDILPNNLIGTYNVYEAAYRAGVERVVFASSNHTIGIYELENSPDLYALDDSRVWDHTVEVRPDSLYGVSKVYGEALGRYYVDRFGLKVFCLRIGTVTDDDDPRAPSVTVKSPALLNLPPEERLTRMRATWLSQRDCAQLIQRCLDAVGINWAVVYGISNNPRQFWDLTHARELLGYVPQDGAPTGED